MLDMPRLKEATGLDMQVGIYHRGFRQVHPVASSKHVFCKCRSCHIPVLEGPSMLCQAMIECPACLSNVRPWALTAGDAVNHPFPLLLWDRIFWVDQLLLQSPERPKGDLDGQGAQHPVD